MPSNHLLPRLATAPLAEAMQDSPVVLIHGPRQSGKSTLAADLEYDLGDFLAALERESKCAVEAERWSGRGVLQRPASISRMDDPHGAPATPSAWSAPPAGADGYLFSREELEAAKSKRVAAGVLGILLGTFGIHKFVLGYIGAGLIMLLASFAGTLLGWLCLPAIAPALMGIVGMIEGIIYLTKSDEEFLRCYILGKRSWF